MRRHVRRAIRSLLYATPMHRWLRPGSAALDGAYWDRQLSGPFRSYLGGTVAVDVRNAVLAAIFRQHHGEGGSILDLGCASGSLARTPGVECYAYTGIDISAFAIEEARRQSPGATFHAARLEEYVPTASHDIIVFSEVLYYLPPERVDHELGRYMAFLRPGGLVFISMKDAPKSQAIMKMVNRRLSWVTGILYQEKPGGAIYRVETSAERPAYLIGVFQPK